MRCRLTAKLATALLALGAIFAPTLTAAATVATVIEFYNPDLDNYFITADPIEQAAVDGGAAGRWQPTGTTFTAGGAYQVCRFYGSASGPNSHFYTADAQEAGVCLSARGLQPQSEELEVREQ